MTRGLYSAILLFFLSDSFFSQEPVQDTVYLMNGHAVGEKVIDTLLGAVTIINPKKPSKKIHYELNQLYMVRYADGRKRYYYQQDTTIYNYFTRDEMWMFMKGEVDARRGYKARGALIGAGTLGLAGGLTGTFWAPVVPYGFMALSGIPKVRIRHNTVSNPTYIESDAYILGYERVARQKLKIQAVIGGTIGLAIGYSMFFLFLK
jgi:hypothetical protein